MRLVPPERVARRAASSSVGPDTSRSASSLRPHIALRETRHPALVAAFGGLHHRRQCGERGDQEPHHHDGASGAVDFPVVENEYVAETVGLEQMRNPHVVGVLERKTRQCGRARRPEELNECAGQLTGPDMGDRIAIGGKFARLREVSCEATEDW